MQSGCQYSGQQLVRGSYAFHRPNLAPRYHCKRARSAKWRPGSLVEELSQGSPWSSSTGHGAKPMGSGTRMTNSCVTSQPTLLIASQEAVPEEPEEQRVDVLQVVSEPNLRWSNACLNFHHFDLSERWLP